MMTDDTEQLWTLLTAINQEFYEAGYRAGKLHQEKAFREVQSRVTPSLPFRERPELDVEYYNHGTMIGTGSAQVQARINASGILMTARTVFTAKEPATITDMIVWIGDQQKRGFARTPHRLPAGGTLAIDFTLTIGLREGDFWWGDRDSGPPPEPPAPKMTEAGNG